MENIAQHNDSAIEREGGSAIAFNFGSGIIAHANIPLMVKFVVADECSNVREHVFGGARICGTFDATAEMC